MGRRNTTLPRGLNRVDHISSRVHLWRVRNQDGSYAYFRDAKFGSKDAALHAALVQLESTPIVGVRSSKFKTNTTGVIGVSTVRHKDTLVAYKAVAGSKHSKPLYKFFYFAEYGENVAFRLACLARAELIANLEGKELLKRNRLIRKLLTQLENKNR